MVSTNILLLGFGLAWLTTLGAWLIALRNIKKSHHVPTLLPEHPAENPLDTVQKELLQTRSEMQSTLQQLSHNMQEQWQLYRNERSDSFHQIHHWLRDTQTQLHDIQTFGHQLNELHTLFKVPQLRGGVGEVLLENLLSSFLPLECFELQANIHPHSTERVDAVIKLHQKKLPIDSKFPRERILPLLEGNNPEQIALARKYLSEWIKQQAKTIATKYICPEEGTTDMALLFLPSETIYFEVVRNSDLFEHLVHLKVFPVGPHTLALCVHAILLAQENQQAAKNCDNTLKRLKKASQQLQRLCDKIEDTGKYLKKACDAHQSTVHLLENYKSAIDIATTNQETP